MFSFYGQKNTLIVIHTDNDGYLQLAIKTHEGLIYKVFFNVYDCYSFVHSLFMFFIMNKSPTRN